MAVMCGISVLLVTLGLVIIAQAQDCPKPVGGPNMSLRDADILLQTFPDGSTVSFVCDVGYTSVGGSAVITCTAGTWSPVRLKCERKDCGSAGEILNGHVDYPEGSQFGDKLVSACNDGYVMIGNPEIICGNKGWMGRLPTCEVVTCYPPAPITNGDFSPKKEEIYSYRDVVIYTCRKDFALNGTKTTTCSENGEFQPDPPNCVAVNCEDPQVDDGFWTGGSRPPHRHMATVTYECKAGYIMVGQPTLVCGIDNKWSPPPPQCRLRASTTTTKATVPSKEPTVPTATTPAPGSGNFLKWGIPTILVVIVAAIILIVLAIKKKGSQRGYSDKNATKDEGVALS